MWVFYLIAAGFGLAFVIGVVRDRRRFRNAVLLGLTAACLGLGLIGEATRLGPVAFDVFQFVLLGTPALVVLVLAVFLILNGLVMIRREGRRLGNLLSLLAGLVLLPLPFLLLAGAYSENMVVAAATVAGLLVVTYLGFLFCCYLAYSWLYGRLRPRPGFDFVVVLGSRLIDGRVPPLLASRLDRAAALWHAETRRGGAPLLVTSGGQGPDEPVPEAHAMARHVVSAGVPAESVVTEDRSMTTLENLGNSHAIMTDRRPGYRCVVVTNNFHVFRAALMTRKAGVDGQVIGSPTAAYYWPSATIREFTAILVEHRIVNLVVVLGLVALGVAVAVL
ncbi:YdcF family protein [Pseudonocardia sp. NPDC049635]|uniref:YdcF family protein n=1 Tax=Pseudonocardia sp. NPDC049635 TaxID=3155506 RepID=UPI0033D78CDE